MKTSTSRLMIAAAALAAAAGGASAQSLKAEIPFAFQASAARMSSGTYVVTTASSFGRQYVVIRNADTGAAAMLAQYIETRAPSAASWAEPAKLSFECARRACVLRELWKGGGGGALRFLGPNLPAGENTWIAEVGLTSLKAD